MSSVGSSPAGVGGSPSILARALPSPLSGSYSWPSPTGFSSGDDDPLFRYVANLPGVGTSTTPPMVNAPPVGTGTPSPARSSSRQSPVRGSGYHDNNNRRIEYAKSTWKSCHTTRMRLFGRSRKSETRTQSTDSMWKTTPTRIGRTTESQWETTPTRLGARTRRWWGRRRWWWDTTFHGRR